MSAWIDFTSRRAAPLFDAALLPRPIYRPAARVLFIQTRLPRSRPHPSRRPRAC